MFPRKRRQRGLDQAAQLAELLAQSLALPYGSGILQRVRDTLPQGDPRVISRQLNVEGAFVVRYPNLIQGRRIILVDDVCTSGSTARECAKVLRQAGCHQVLLVTAAQA